MNKVVDEHYQEPDSGGRMLTYLLVAAALAVVGWMVFARDTTPPQAQAVPVAVSPANQNIVLMERSDMGDGNIIEVIHDKNRHVTCYRTSRWSNSVAINCIPDKDLKHE